MKEADFPRLLQGRMFTLDDLETVRRLIAENPNAMRRNLAIMLCQLWGWYSPAGKVKVISATELLQKLNAAGLVVLPLLKSTKKKGKRQPLPHTSAADPKPLLKKSLAELLPLHFEQVTMKNKSAFWNELIERYHYLGKSHLFGARLRYLVYSEQEVIAAISFSAAAWQIEPRDSFIGWNEQQRRRNLQLVVNNSRFLILPWIKCKNLASTLLSQATKKLVDDWEGSYGYRPALLETFVDGEQFGGTCYSAANWVYVGFTKGRGRQEKRNKRVVSEKDIFLYPLQKDFRKRLLDEYEHSD